MEQKQPQNITPQVKERIRVASVSLGVAEPPSIINKRGKDYVYFGDENLYPHYLIDLYNESPTHGAIINGKVNYITGRGLFSENPKADVLLQRANRTESWNQLLNKIALDYEIHNRYYIEVVRTMGNGKSYYHLDASRIRVDEEEQVWTYSDNWMKNGKVNYRPTTTKFILYDPNRLKPFTDKDGTEYREIIPYDEYRPNFESYAFPNYMNILTAIEAEAEISNYDLNQWKFGFLGATMVNFNSGEPEKETDKDEIIKTVKDTIGGSGGTNILINWADSKDEAAEIVGVKGEDAAQEADLAARRIQGTIFTGHGVTSPGLLGVMNTSAFSGNDDKEEAYKLFKETYVEGRQQVLLRTIEETLGVEDLDIRPLKEITKDIPIAEIAPYFDAATMKKIISEKYGIEEEVKVQEVEPVEEVAFSSKMSEEQEKILTACKKYGKHKSEFRVISDRGCNFKDSKIQFADLSELDLYIMKVLGDNPEFSATELAENIELNKKETSISDVFIRLGQLVGIGWILQEGANYAVSRLGKSEARNEPLPEIKLQTVYSYELRPDAPALKGHSREFCQEMVATEKYYTKEEINKLDNDLGTNVWMTRGGWYTKPDTDVSLPFCRHWWVQKIVEAK